MAKLSELTHWLDEYLAIHEIADSCWNGLQVEGKENVAKVALAVDAGQASFLGAVEAGADILIVHHGHFWRERNPGLVSWRKQRLDLLRQHGVSLYAAHLPLDRHPEVGNNAQLLRLLTAERHGEFLLHEGKNVGWQGRLSPPRPREELQAALDRELSTTCMLLPFGPKLVKTAAVVSGGGGYSGFSEAVNAGVDLYVTGDRVEVYQAAKDAGINVLFAGHYATETVGLKALAHVLEERCGVQTEFLDLPTGL